MWRGYNYGLETYSNNERYELLNKEISEMFDDIKNNILKSVPISFITPSLFNDKNIQCLCK